MKRNIYYLNSFLTLLLLLFAGTASAQTYCTSGATSTYDSKCDGVKLVGSSTTIDNNTSANGCAQYSDFTSSVAPADLSPGANYTVEVTQGTCGGNYTRRMNVWIDFNRDGDFTDAGEMLGTGTQGSGASGLTRQFPFTVPCNAVAGSTRMRVIVVEGTPTNPCLTYTWGETEDYTVTILSPSGGLSSNFLAPDSVFVNTPGSFVNSNQTGYISHTWTIDGTTYNTTNASHKFTTTGTYDVKLVSENCLGKDSTTKQVRVVAPTTTPIANFVANQNVVEMFETFKLYDLSTNGPVYWDWFLTNGTDTIDGDDQLSLRGDNSIVSNKNPTVETGNYPGAVGIGTWDVYLKSTNSLGASPYATKVGYITVQQTSFNIGPGTIAPITAASGTIYDKNGPDNDYPTTNDFGSALISPCGAQSITISFSTFAVNANANLKIFDGTNALGTLLSPAGGFTAGDDPTTIGSITATSGAMYLLWTQTSGPADEGFAANWTSVQGSGAAPIADIQLPVFDIYNSVPVNFLSTSLNTSASSEYEWTISGPEPGTSYSKDIENIIFTSNGTYTISLKVTNCDGVVSSITKTFDVLAPNTPTDLDFTADNRRPSVGDNVTLSAISDKANRWEWNFFPPTGVEAVAPTSDMLSDRTFKFTTPGVYAVQLKGYSSVDSANSEATVVKTTYIIVVENCVPIIGVTTSSDVGISYVSVQDAAGNGTLYENASAVGDKPYTNYSDLGTIPLNYGGEYAFEVRRNSNVNNMTRKIWIDWNVDGDFEDAGELVAEETTAGNSSSWTGTFTVPDAANAFDATATLRVGVSLDNDLNLPCGAASNGAANKVGEFEDYSVRVINDGDEPVITLIDADTIYIEQGATPGYMTAGATALDPSQGDITGNINMTSDLDQSLPGVYYEVYNVMDASGNSAPTVTRVIYVVADQTAPVITINGSADTTIEVGTPWADLGATALDNKEGNLTSAIVTTGNVDHTVLGDYMVTYDISDNQGNAATAVRTVRVVDTQVPVIENPRADKSGACWVVEVQLQNIFADITTATDNYNALGNGLSFKASPASAQGGAAVDTRFQGTTSVTYTATDESGNVTTQCIDYVVRDYIAPVIDLRTLDVVYHEVNNPYTPVAATASDNLYNSTEISLSSTSNVDPYTLGTYQDTYTATDAAGNTSTIVRTVHVVDTESPVILGKNGGVVKLGVGSQYNMVDALNFSDNYDAPADLLANLNVLYSDVNLQEAGLYSFVVETKDNSDNKSEIFTLYVDVQHKYEQSTNSINDLSLENMLTIAPNPTRGAVNINVNLPEKEEINIAIFNSLGQQVVLVENGAVSNNSYNVSLANQANGIYYVKMNVKGSIITKKVMLNK